MRILALDLSSKSTGWAIFDNNNLNEFTNVQFIGRVGGNE